MIAFETIYYLTLGVWFEAFVLVGGLSYDSQVGKAASYAQATGSQA